MDLPVVGANGGLEAITYVPDSFLVQQSLYDEALGLLLELLRRYVREPGDHFHD